MFGTRFRAALIGVAAVTLGGAGSAPAAFPGANGKIAYSYDPPPVGGLTTIAAIGPDGQGFAQLTDPGPGFNDYDPSYSPDGEQVAFIRVPQPANSGQVWTMNADGSGQTQLTAGTPTAQDFGPAFSPDGKWIAFDRYNGTAITQIWVMRADGSDQTQLTFASESSRSPSFSPDGSKLVFSRSGSGGDGIWTMNADGSGTPQQLTPGSATAQDSRPSYSPDGQRIVFDRYNAGNSDVVVMNSDGSDQQPFMPTVPFDVSTAFSPDGTRVAFLRGGDELFLADPDGANQAPVPGGTDVYGQSSITWQPLNPPACELTGEATQKSFKRIDVTVTCSNENAAATLSGVGEAKKVPKGAGASKKKRFEIPAVSAQVPAATATAVSLPIPKKGRKALKRAAKAGKRGSATVTAILTDDFGETSQDTLAVAFKKKKKK